MSGLARALDGFEHAEHVQGQPPRCPRLAPLAQGRCELGDAGAPAVALREARRDRLPGELTGRRRGLRELLWPGPALSHGAGEEVRVREAEAPSLPIDLDE